eukprot:CAMPEP_0171623408 /NCGR_PEP_ID=MMETSP0990-20121206/17926_1 /TAXON_ID=483369 /ORGANISM="non described non described, Strain CCMP2098" /LENGTH=515 /DNA_ID=CAMNT_0012189601 /DNA_START=258 /DNA_END=1805 /DNA_ORIENTATION=+
MPSNEISSIRRSSRMSLVQKTDPTPQIELKEPTLFVDENGHYPRTGRRGAPQVFPRKLYEILSQENTDTVSWNQLGTNFVIADMEDFTENILMHYFRHTKYSSFQRQLNLYGFRKVAKGPDTGAYAHEAFLRDQPGRLEYVRRLPQGLVSSPPPKRKGAPGSNGGNHKIVIKRSGKSRTMGEVATSSFSNNVAKPVVAAWLSLEEDGDGDDEADEEEEGDAGESSFSKFKTLPGAPHLSFDALAEMAMSSIEGQLSPPPPQRPSFRDECSEDSATSETETTVKAAVNSVTGYWQDDFTSGLFEDESRESGLGANEKEHEGDLIVRHQPLPEELVIPREAMLLVFDSSVSNLSESVNKLALDKRYEQHKLDMLQLPEAAATPAVTSVHSVVSNHTGGNSSGTIQPPESNGTLRVHLRVPSLTGIDPLDMSSLSSGKITIELASREFLPSSAFDLEPPSPTSPLFAKGRFLGRLTSEDWQVSSLVNITGAPNFDPAALDTIFARNPSAPPQPVEMER